MSRANAPRDANRLMRELMLENGWLRSGIFGSLLLGPLLLQACSGPEGAVGTMGPDGPVGNAGDGALIRSQHFDALEGCPNGGVALSIGTDDGGGDGAAAGNGVLENAEIDDTENLCDGPAGDTGLDGNAGLDGGTGPAGPSGATGPVGATGAAGPFGATGPAGATGAPADAASTVGFDGLVAYASGDPIELTIEDGVTQEVALPAFGTWASFDIAGAAGSIDLTGDPGTLLNTAFSAPADGFITRLSAFFSTTTPQVLGTSSIQYGVALYVEADADNSFDVILDSVAGFTDLTGNTPPGTAESIEVSPLVPIPVEAGTRILMVVAASSTDLTLDSTLAGYFSGSIQFEALAD
jgi:BclB C-terminal domain-containing protein